MKSRHEGISIKVVGILFAIVIGGISIVLFGSLFMQFNKFNDVQTSTANYMAWKDTALEVSRASDYLTDQSRYYVYNKHKVYMDNYFEEAKINQRRDHAIEVIKTYLPHTKAEEGITAAVNRSKELMSKEYYAMRLIVDSLHIEMDESYPIEVRETILKEEDALLNDEDKQLLALDYVIGESYLNDKEFINQKVNEAVSEIDTMMEKGVITDTEELKGIIIFQEILIVLNVVFVSVGIIFIFLFLIFPINQAIEKLKLHKNMEMRGFKEYRYLADAYNEAREQSNNTKQKLLYEAEHDKLTGLYNRTGYDSIYRIAKLENCFYILIDIDLFKGINDEYGHEVGDKVLIRVANIINKVFNQDNEYAFRIGGDEFAVLVEHNENITTDDLMGKCMLLNLESKNNDKKTPKYTLSIGIAKGTNYDTTDTLFRKADKALYNAKNSGRDRISVYRD